MTLGDQCLVVKNKTIRRAGHARLFDWLLALEQFFHSGQLLGERTHLAAQRFDFLLEIGDFLALFTVRLLERGLIILDLLANQAGDLRLKRHLECRHG